MTSEPLDPHSFGEELERLFGEVTAADHNGNRSADPAPPPAEPVEPALPEGPGAPGLSAAALRAMVESAVTQALAPVVDELRAAGAGREAEPAGLDRADFHHELDDLRAQLETAFDEVVSLVRAGVRLARSQDDRLEHLEAHAVDTGANVRLLAEQIADGRSQHRSDLHRLTEQVAAGPLEVDTRRLEEVVHRGAIANAADIANLSSELQELIAAIRAHDATLTELRKQIEWIKQRVLSR